MSVTQDYKLVTLSRDQAIICEVALSQYIRHLDDTAQGNYSDWSAGEKFRANAESALAALVAA